MASSKQIDIFFKTQNPFKSYRFQWAVENYSKIKWHSPDGSPNFEPLENSVWYSTLKKGIIDSKGIFVVSFHKVSSNYSNVSVVVNICINNGAKWIDIANIPNYKSTDNATASFAFFCNGINPNLYNLNYLPNDSLEFECFMEFRDYDISTTHLIYKNPELSSTVINTLSNDLKKLLESSVSADVVFKVKGRNFPAHRSILSIRSNVFEKMFQNDMKESATGVVEINDIEPDIFKHLLDYLYAGIYPSINFETALSLYKAADKYLLLELQNICVEILLSKMEISNVVTFLNLIDMHKNTDMLNYIVRFLKFHLKMPDTIMTLLSGDVSSTDAVKILKNLLSEELDKKIVLKKRKLSNNKQ